ncbi:MAG: SDR family NAD(P)-dependent oxidoreductase [Steroidobacteraceae bacterium]|jgi:NAD(P)-dependent dehydrogenase (short-subunit alcohol dehydrogenase family)
MTGRLAGKVAVVTGAGSGLGRAAAQRFAAEGAQVGCADIDMGLAEAAAADIVAAGGRALAIQLDAASMADNDRMADRLVTAWGRIDVLYANAGIASVGSVTTVSEDEWDRVMAVHLKGTWLASRAVIPAMEAAGGGSIINQASIGALVGFSGIAAYAAAKGGIISLTRQAAIEYAHLGIRCNAVCPGTVPTALVKETYERRGGLDLRNRMPLEEALAANANRYPLKRLGTAEDIANLAVFLASDESAWITGGVFPVDGGYTAA